MFADLASQIDNLPDDGEDDGVFLMLMTRFNKSWTQEPLPQYNQPKNTSKAGKPGASGFGGGSGKKGEGLNLIAAYNLLKEWWILVMIQNLQLKT